MFEERGPGGAFYGLRWAELSDSWRTFKIKHGFPSVIGVYRGKLLRSLTQPGSEENILEVSNQRGVFGSRVSDVETGYHYSRAFSDGGRPVIGVTTARELREWFTRGPGEEALGTAASVLKSSWRHRLRGVKQ
jgi:hypothetical protein